MGVFRIYSLKSNTIASGVFENFNSGQNASAEIWYGGSEFFSNRNSISRHISKYDISKLQEKINSKEIMSGNVTSYKLYMKNSIPRDAALETDFTFNKLTKEIASSFDLIAFPINKDWDEGKGHDLIKANYVVKQLGNPRITGYSNWNYSKRTTQWDEPGIFSSPTASTTNFTYSGDASYKGVVFSKLENETSGETFTYSIESSTGITSQFSVVITGTTGGTLINYTFNPLSGSTSPEFYSGQTTYSGMTFFRDSGTSEVYIFEIISSDSISTSDNVFITGNSIDYTYNPLSGSSFTASAYTGSVIYSGLTFIKNNDASQNVYDFSINTSSASTVSFSSTTTGNNTFFTFNPLSGSPSTLDFKNTITGDTNFTSLGIDVLGGSSGTIVTSGDSFSLSANTFVPSVLIPFTPSTLDFQNALNGNTGFTSLNINVSGGSSGTTITSGDSFSLSATTLIPITTFEFNPNTLDLITGLTSNNDYLNLEINNSAGNTSAITSGDSFFITTNNVDDETRLWSEQHFDIGDEDINMDITPMVNRWINGESDNNGVGISFREDYESLSANTRSVTSFLTNKTNTAFKPYIEVVYDQVIKDDRNQVTNNRVSRLFLYTYSGNNAVNFYSAGTVDIISPNNTVLISGITPTQLQKGVYYIDVLMSAATPGQVYRDVWRGVTFSPGVDKQDYEQRFSINKNYYLNASPSINDYSISTYGIDNGSILRQEDVVRVFADIRINYTQKRPSPFFEIKYSMIMNNQEEVIPWTSMNRTVRNGMQEIFFDIDTSWLLHNQSYEILFKIEELGSSKVLSEKINFKVLRDF